MDLFTCLGLFQAKDLPTFKDIDFLTENNRIIIGNEAKDEVLAKLKSDSEVMKSDCFGCISSLLITFNLHKVQALCMCFNR